MTPDIQPSQAPVAVSAPGLVMTEHVLTVPLDHEHVGERQIEVFAREVADPDGRDRPFLVYLQGGPGHGGEPAVGDPPRPGVA